VRVCNGAARRGPNVLAETGAAGPQLGEPVGHIRAEYRQVSVRQMAWFGRFWSDQGIARSACPGVSPYIF
jgi:hypothetical protein